ncbi:MAG: hypothetical protein C4560_06650 [Nitrospiraceae bacterium]|nr:MAG: hypothetical protein C4560_06650 [Nitrospiraceae bacterium]
MKDFIRKILFFDRTTLTLASLSVVAAVSVIMVSVFSGNRERENKALNAQLTELMSLREATLDLKNTVESKDRKTGPGKSVGIVSTLEQTLKNLGVKATVLRPLTKNRIKEFTEEDAELEIRNIDLNSIVNLLYKIDNAPLPMKVKNVLIKTGFEDPNKFVLKLTVSVINKG